MDEAEDILNTVKISINAKKISIIFFASKGKEIFKIQNASEIQINCKNSEECKKFHIPEKSQKRQKTLWRRNTIKDLKKIEKA